LGFTHRKCAGSGKAPKRKKKNTEAKNPRNEKEGGKTFFVKKGECEGATRGGSKEGGKSEEFTRIKKNPSHEKWKTRIGLQGGRGVNESRQGGKKGKKTVPFNPGLNTF